MGANDQCPVCKEPFERRIEVSAGGATVNVADAETVCFSPHYERICVH